MDQQVLETKEFKNDEIEVQLTHEPGCHIKLHVVASPTLNAQAYAEALKAVKKEISIPGFRKGKVPDALLFKNYQRPIEQEWKDALANKAFNAAIQLSGYYPTKQAASGIKSSLQEIKGPNDPATLSFSYECEPTPPTIDFNSISLKQKAHANSVSESEVQDLLEQTRLLFSEWEVVEGRPAQEDDFVKLDIERIEEGNTELEHQDQRFKVTPTQMSQWIRSLVIGLSPGESAEGMSAPEEILNQELDEEIRSSFQPAPYRITLKSIEKPKSPEFNEDFAKKLGASSMDEVMERLRHQLQLSNEAKAKKALMEQLKQRLLETYGFDLPLSILQREEIVLKNFKRSQLQEQGHPEEDPNLEAEISAQARQRITLFYLMRQFNYEQNIEVSKQEVDLEFGRLFQNIPEEHLNELLRSIDENVYRTVLSNLLVEKGLFHLLSLVKIETEENSTPS